MSERVVPEGLLPHRGPARLVEAIVQTAGEILVCRGRVPGASAFAAGGRVPAAVLIELAAQAAAVQHALAAPAGPGAPPGYLVAIRSASLHVGDVPTDVPFQATVRRTGQAGPLATYDVQVTGRDGEEILRATLSTHAGG